MTVETHLHVPEERCRAFADPVELVGKRWSAAVLLAARLGSQRFSEFRTVVAGISDRLLSQRLKELEKEGLMARTVVPSSPVQVLYRLTPAGEELVEALQPLVDWAHRWRPTQPPA